MNEVVFLKIEEIKKYLETKKNEANDEFQNAKNESSDKILNNARFLAFYEILEWIEEKEKEEHNNKFHVKGEKTR